MTQFCEESLYFFPMGFSPNKSNESGLKVPKVIFVFLFLKENTRNF